MWFILRSLRASWFTQMKIKAKIKPQGRNKVVNNTSKGKRRGGGQVIELIIHSKCQGNEEEAVTPPLEKKQR